MCNENAATALYIQTQEIRSKTLERRPSMIIFIATSILIVFVIIACANLICAQFNPDDLRDMGVGR